MTSESTVTRRGFMFGAGAFGVAAYAGHDIAPKSAFSGEIKGRRLKIAAVGCGGMGGSATESLISAGCDLVAVCDIDPSAFDRWEKKYPGIPKFTDYRDMLRPCRWARPTTPTPTSPSTA